MLAPLLGTAALLPGPLRDVPCLLLQAWLGQGTQGQLQIKEVSWYTPHGHRGVDKSGS